MNLSQDKRSPVGGHNAGAVAFGGHNNAAPAQFAVGEVGFGPNWNAEDSMAASIVRLECEADELRAEVVMLKQAMLLLAQERDNARARVKVLSKCWREAEEERDEARVQYRSTHALAESLVKTIGELKSERVELKATINTYRDEACRESCRDKAAADGGWANI
jgi:cell division protein FtsB